MQLIITNSIWPIRLLLGKKAEEKVRFALYFLALWHRDEVRW